jgi:nucleoid-associated protein YgaU
MSLIQSISRYYKQPVADSSGTYISVRKYNPGSNYYLYTTKTGDSFDLIASRIMNDPERYWEIADLNSHVPFPDEIPIGTVLRIPVQ